MRTWKRRGYNQETEEGYNLWSEVDGLRAKKRAAFIHHHSLEGLNTEGKISKVKHLLNTLGNKAIQDRRDAREKHNAKLREGKILKGEKKAEKQAKKRAREEEDRENYLERSGKRPKKNLEERERMKKDPEFKKTVFKRQATTTRRNLKSDNTFKKLTGEVYQQNKIAHDVGKILTKVGVELPGSVEHEQGLIKAKKTEGYFFKKKKKD